MSGNGNNVENNWLDTLLENSSSNLTKYNEALVYVRQNFMEFYPEDLFLQLDRETLLKLLESDDLNVPNEEVVFDSVKRWLDFHNLNPNTHLKSLLYVVRLSLFPKKYLLDVVEPYVYPVLNCREAFLDVLRYHMLGENKINETFRKYQKISPGNIKSNLNSKTIPESLAGSDDLNTEKQQTDSSGIPEKPEPNAEINKLYLDSKTISESTETSSDRDDLNTARQQTQSPSFPVKLEPNIETNSGDLINKDTEIEKQSSNKLVFLGSWDINTGNVIETFDVIEKKWLRLKNLSLRKRIYSANIIDNKLLIIGGFFKKPLNTIDAIDLSTGKMITLPPIKEARYYAPNVVVREENKEVLYLVGGWGIGGLLASVEIWDPAANEWTNGVPMTSNRTGHGVAYLNGKIYSVGGRVKGPYLNIVEAFDIKDKIWTSKAPMKSTNGYFGITTFKDHIYVVGGLRKLGAPISVVERYNPLNDSWTTLANIKSHRGVGVCSFGNRMICAGGTFKYVEEYEEEENKWVSLPSMNVARSGFLLELPEDAKLEN